MAMYNYNLYSFTHVEHLYNNTKPIRGTDIVPLGDRKRKREHIVKVSPTHYALCEKLAVPKYSHTSWYKSQEQIVAEAAVVWTHNADGTDTVQFRNETAILMGNSRYSFLDRCMPINMDFIVEGGKQYIRHEGNRYYLPKHKDKVVAFTAGRTKSSHPEFTHNAPWVLTSDPHPVPVTRIRVNKEAKAPYKKAIDEYLHWAWTMTPLIEGTMDWKSNNNAMAHASWMRGIGFLELLNDTQHEHRTTMLHAFLCRMAESAGNRYWYNSTQSPTNVSLTSDPKKFRTKFNAWVNDMGEFNESFEEYREVK
jgi:hypothetical protein